MNIKSRIFKLKVESNTVHIPLVGQEPTGEKLVQTKEMEKNHTF